MVTILTRRLEFPPATKANRDGLIAVGGDLSVERLLLAYQSGIFPWPIFDDEWMTWFSPDPRAILELDDLHISRSLRKTFKKPNWTVTFNKVFEQVIAACAAPARDRPTTWITRDLTAAYVALHREGHAHSVETWWDGVLVGGLYGVTIGGLFAGESMFSRMSNASKIALVHLVDRLREKDFDLLDVQQPTAHMMSMGGSLISRAEYLRRLAATVDRSVSFA